MIDRLPEQRGWPSSRPFKNQDVQGEVMKTICLTLSLLAACPKSSQKLAVASDAISHGLANADTAANQAVTTGVITAADRDLFHSQLVRVSQAGLVLDSAIRANESATTLSAKVNSFLD